MNISAWTAITVWAGSLLGIGVYLFRASRRSDEWGALKRTREQNRPARKPWPRRRRDR